MYKMIIVDDEKRVRKGLQVSVNWEEYDIEVVGEAADGKEGLELLKKEEPEIIITDIYMPEMDGLELITEASVKIPHSKAIILSGYEDFDYAQKAIREHAFDYILKPVKIEKMIKVVEKAKKQIKEELSRIQNEEKLKNQLEESKPVIKERCLDYILTNRLTLSDVKKQYNYINLNLSDEYFAILVIELDNFRFISNESDKEVIKKQISMLSIKNAIYKIVNNDFRGEVIEDYPERFICILNYIEEVGKNDQLDDVQSTAQKIQNFIKKFYQQSVSIGIGRLYRDEKNINESYKEAVEALKYRNFHSSEEIIYIGDVTIARENFSAIYPLDKEEKIVTSLKTGNIIESEKYTREFICHLLEKKQISSEKIKRICIQLVYGIFKELIGWNLDYEVNANPIETDILKSSSSKELEQILVGFIKKTTNCIRKEKECQKHSQIHKACQFIKENYNHDITLKEIADSVYLTPNYFANLFKEETGKTVITYLTEIRINRAQELLLLTKDKVYKVAEKVGFNDSKYFSQVFKKYAEVTPLEYRQNN